MRPIRIQTCLAIAAWTLVAATVPARADQFTYTLSTGVRHSDNINLSSTNPISQNVLIPGVDFNYTQLGSKFQANISGALEYRDYLGGAFDNQTFTALSANTNWTLLPQRLDFVVQDVASVEPLSTLSSNAPNNLQQTNVFTVGPSLHFLLGSTLHGEADLRYIHTNASKTKQFNSSRGVAAFHLIKDFSPVSQLSANVQAQRVRFNNFSGVPHYTRIDAYLGYSSKLKILDYTLSAGGSRIRFQNAGTVSGSLLRAIINWHASPHSTFTLSGRREYSDAAQDLQYNMLTSPMLAATPTNRGSLINTGSEVINAQLYLLKRINTTYAYGNDTFELSISPFAEKTNYIHDKTLNLSARGISTGFDYRLTPNLTFSGYANGSVRKYHVLDRRDNTVNYGIGLNDRFAFNWTWHLLYDHRSRTSTASGQNYKENEIYLGIAYKR